MIPPYTLFDSEVSPDTEKLDDAFILEMIVLMDYAEPDVGDLAEVFGLSLTEVYNFFHEWRTNSYREHGCVAEAWVAPLGLTADDAETIQDILAAAVAKASQCKEYGVNYVDFTYDLLTTLDAARVTGNLRLVPGIDTEEELDTAWAFYERGATAVSKLMARRDATRLQED